MLRSSRVFATIPCEDPHKVREFYEATLGLEPIWASPHTGEACYDCGDGSGICLYRTHVPKGESTVATFLVDDIDKEMADLRAKGVIFEDYDLPGLKTEHGISADEMGRSCWFKDPAGSVLALTEVKAGVIRKAA